ncbi:MAG TPA: ABC transporter ATP-binding protein [Solirubrobacteraceae bacterium]|nr:ABC transporter ATP-binding protein [Solirubrobacteraceae bacterium]
MDGRPGKIGLAGVVVVWETPYGGVVIDVQGVTKRYGEKLAVDDLSFQVRPGVVTGFLGPNGAGKSTTMRLILGLDRPTSGEVTVNGLAYRELPAPLHEIGAMLEAHAIHTGRSAFNHLLALAQTHGISRSRVQEVIELVGLREVARKRVGGFSLGMGQRLGVAAALLGDPATVILDEPANGLDPEGIHWIRNLLKGLAVEGRTVFLSSHLMSEMAQTADHLIVVGRGRLIADTSVAEFVRRASSGANVRVRSPQSEELRAALERREVEVQSLETGLLEVSGLSGEQIGELALEARIVISELTPQQASLEEAFMSLTGESVEYRAGAASQDESEIAGPVRSAA